MRARHSVVEGATPHRRVGRAVAELYVGGQWVIARAGGRREIRCPAHGSLRRRGRRGRAGGHRGRDRRRRRRPLHPGPGRARRRRSAATCCCGWADLLERDAAIIAELESRDTGKRLVESEYDVADAVSVFRHYGKVAAEEAGLSVHTGNPEEST